MARKSTISSVGVVTYWNLSESKLKKLTQACTAVDEELANFLPEQPSPITSLKAALESVFPDKLVRKLKTPGFGIVTEERGDSENDYSTEATAIFYGSERDSADIRFKNLDKDKQTAIREAYNHNRSLLPPAQIGSCLSKIVVTFLGGTTLRPSGGVYWLPEDRIAKWQKIAEAVESASIRGETNVYMLNHKMDEASAKAVRDAILYEMQTECDRINTAVTEGELGDRGLKSLEDGALEMIKKLERYESLLNTELTSMRKSLDQAKDAAAAAAVLAAAGVPDSPRWNGLYMTAIIRYCGSKGWTAAQAKAVAKHCGFQPAGATVNIQLARGAKKEDVPELDKAKADELKEVAAKVTEENK